LLRFVTTNKGVNVHYVMEKRPGGGGTSWGATSNYQINSITINDSIPRRRFSMFQTISFPVETLLANLAKLVPYSKNIYTK